MAPMSLPVSAVDELLPLPAGNGIFIAATGTDVGKTFVTALLIKAWRDAGLAAGYYKAALSGAEFVDGKWVAGDAEYVRRVAGLPDPADALVTYVYREAVSPHLAAQHEGNPVELSRVLADYRQVQIRHPFVFVEGSGGIICPLRYDDTAKVFLTDIIRLLNLSVVIVAPAGLGTINSTLLTVEHARQKNILVRGVILNRYTDSAMERDNVLMIERLAEVPILAKVAPNATAIALDQAAIRTIGG